MITCKISAGSSSIVQDIIDMCVSLAPIGNWQGFVYKSTTGSKPWCVWAQRMDEDAHELQYVYSSGLAVAPDAYELITVTCPTTTGFTLSFTQVNSMPSVVQSGKGGGGGGRSSVSSVPIIKIRVSAAASTALADFNAVGSHINATNKFYYISTHGDQPWAVYAWYQDFGTNVPAAITLITMSGLASPSAESEALAIAAPSTATLNTDGYIQLTGPLSISFTG